MPQRLPERRAKLWLCQEHIVLTCQIEKIGPLEPPQHFPGPALQPRHVTPGLEGLGITPVGSVKRAAHLILV